MRLSPAQPTMRNLSRYPLPVSGRSAPLRVPARGTAARDVVWFLLALTCLIMGGVIGYAIEGIFHLGGMAS